VSCDTRVKNWFCNRTGYNQGRKVVVNAGSDAVEEVCAASRDPEMSEEGNPKSVKI